MNCRPIPSRSQKHQELSRDYSEASLLVGGDINAGSQTTNQFNWILSSYSAVLAKYRLSFEEKQDTNVINNYLSPICQNSKTKTYLLMTDDDCLAAYLNRIALLNVPLCLLYSESDEINACLQGLSDDYPPAFRQCTVSLSCNNPSDERVEIQKSFSSNELLS
ncbi:unnamed protein product [Larinioides sclopetarius]|uniref:Uncharacterized protein n=1 Tax=Larinioides sclopetarius TaxID=280406 RepID=A0AAV1Z136_9ARAC